MNTPLHRFKAEFFKVIGHPARLALLDHLRDGEKSVGELQVLLGADQSTVSQHLAKLRSANIVEARKEGTSGHYSVSDPTIFKLLDVAREIFNNQLVGTQEMLQQLNEEVT